MTPAPDLTAAPADGDGRTPATEPPSASVPADPPRAGDATDPARALGAGQAPAAAVRVPRPSGAGKAARASGAAEAPQSPHTAPAPRAPAAAKAPGAPSAAEAPATSAAAAPEEAERDPRWTRVLARDRSADGAFVYAVATTGVYCRPSCPSRRPHPRHVRFFAGPDAAEAAGFRPCRRCAPRGPSPAAAWAARVADACRRIEAAEEPPQLADLAAAAGMSPAHFHRRFKAATGLTPRAYGAARRAARVRDGLAKGEASVTEAIYEAGFNASSRFYEGADAALGMTPAAFRRGGAGERIRFALAQCALGALLVARSGRGVCAIALGDDPAELLRDFQDRFPAAELVGGDAEFEALTARVVGLVEAPGIGLDLPLDLQGTAFQQRVWRALAAIPPGRTASYAEIARAIGAPGSARAVAQACAANPVAVAIPCHRVVRGDGSLSGYRWGVERKRALLAREAEG